MPKLLGRKGLRAYWAKARATACQADRCLHPGQPIDYSGRRGPLALDVGHIIPVVSQPHRTAWAITETRPEHAACNRTAGTVLGNRRRGARRARVKVAASLDTSRAW